MRRAINIAFHITRQIKHAKAQEANDAKREIKTGVKRFLFFAPAKYTAAI